MTLDISIYEPTDSKGKAANLVSKMFQEKCVSCLGVPTHVSASSAYGENEERINVHVDGAEKPEGVIFHYHIANSDTGRAWLCDDIWKVFGPELRGVK